MRESDSRKIRKTGLQTEASDSNAPSEDTPFEDRIKTYLCVRCGKTFSESLELTLHAKGSVEIYDACPYCFSRVNAPGDLEKDSKGRTQDIEKTAVPSCTHSLGYLKTHPKGTPYPDECLTCAVIMQCIAG